MKFVFISGMDGSPWGGSEELWTQAAIRLSQARHEVQASVVYWPRLSEKITALTQHGVDMEAYPSFHAGPARKLWDRFSLRYRRSYARLKRFKPDLAVISIGYISEGFDWAAVCRRTAIPYVIILHCNSELWWFRELLGEAVATYTGARRIFCVSQHNLDLLRLQVGEPLPDAEVVRNPCNVSIDCPPAWHDEEDGWQLANVARLDLEAKGQELLLQTLARPEWRDRPVQLNLFGTGPDEQILRSHCKMLQLTNVHFRGHVSDVRGIWEQNHLLVLPSRFEGLPLALVEAMWCARPAVVTDVGGNAELCADNETGFVAAAATVPLFAEALERAWKLRNDWSRMGLAARARVECRIPADPIASFCERLKVLAACRA